MLSTQWAPTSLQIWYISPQPQGISESITIQALENVTADGSIYKTPRRIQETWQNPRLHRSSSSLKADRDPGCIYAGVMSQAGKNVAMGGSNSLGGQPGAKAQGVPQLMVVRLATLLIKNEENPQQGCLTMLWERAPWHREVIKLIARLWLERIIIRMAETNKQTNKQLR